MRTGSDTIRIIEEKCNRCMLCVRDCVSGVLREENGAPVAAAPHLCNFCSHCLAVCPKGAVVHDRLAPGNVRPVRRKMLNAEAYREIIVSRRSVRHYKKKPVSGEVLDGILDIARYSPTASNSQEVGYIVITDKNRLGDISHAVFDIGLKVHQYSASRSLGPLISGLKRHPAVAAMLNKYIEPMEYYMELQGAGRDLILHNAPVLILLHSPTLSLFGADNCNIAAANITNLAHAEGLGTCYIGFLKLALKFHGRLRELASVPRGRTVQSCLVMGYPDFPYRNTPVRKAPEIKWIPER